MFPTPKSPESQPLLHQPRKHPCVLCQHRKVKCDRNYPCNNCVKAHVDCISAASLPPRKRKKRFSEAELLARLRRYEECLKGYGADLKAINEGGEGQKRNVGDVGQTEAMKSLSIRRSLRNCENNLWAGITGDFQETEEILQGSSEDEMFETPITKTFDNIFSGENEFFLLNESNEPLETLHPSPIHIFRLWQTFLDSVNPIIKLFHAPTVQQQVLDASSNLENISRPMEALMFCMYASAIYSLGNEECRNMFGEERSVLLNRYHSGAKQALHRAEVLRSSDMTILQALILYLISCLHFSMDPRSLFCLTGIAIRIAQRMGLNFDGTNYGLLPFEVEMRRRLWWQLVLLDMRVADLSGAGSSILTYQWTTRLPLNINDSDLFPGMRETPPEHPSVTEMVYVLQRCEVCELIQHQQVVNGSPEVKKELIDELEDRLHRKYLKYCDPSVPLHSLSAMMAKMAICRLRMGPTQRTLMSSLGSTVSQAEKDRIFSYGLTTIETHNILLKSANMKRFQWHIYTNFPLTTQIYIICALRHRFNDELADRAWKELEEGYSLRTSADYAGPRKNLKNSPLHLAVANMTIKAWEARQNALSQYQQAVPETEYISVLRNNLATSKIGKGAGRKGGKVIAESALGGDGIGWEGMFNQPQGNGMNPGFDTSFLGGFDTGFMNGFVEQDMSLMEWGVFDDSMSSGNQATHNS